MWPRRVRRIRKTTRICALAIALAFAVVAQPAPANAQEVSSEDANSRDGTAKDSGGFQVRDGRLFDGYGNDFIMRGVNHPHAWFDTQLGSLADIKATGANTVRVVLSNGAQFTRTEATDVAAVVAQCRQARLVCVLELQDTTGYPDVSEAIPLEAAVDYWIDVADAVRGHESFVLINIGNEPSGNQQVDQWLPATISAIDRLRQAGFHHTLVVGAPNWGQDHTFRMRDSAAHILSTDPLHNILFDVHMYGMFDTAVKVRSYIESFVRAELPLMIGEFGAMHTVGDPAEEAVMHWAQMYGIGYVGWSWSGNTAPVADLNLVLDFEADQRTPWGSQLIESPYGITQTSIEASIFGEPRFLPRPMLATAPEPLPAPTDVDRPVPIALVEAEDSTRNGLQVSLQGSGFSGDGYLTGFDARGDSVTMIVHVDHDGQYQLGFGYRSPYGDKTQQLTVNDERMGPALFPESPSFATASYGEVALVAGNNRITLTHDWGWFDLDNVQIFPATNN